MPDRFRSIPLVPGFTPAAAELGRSAGARGRTVA
jgi:hypothetical protein